MSKGPEEFHSKNDAEACLRPGFAAGPYGLSPLVA